MGTPANSEEEPQGEGVRQPCALCSVGMAGVVRRD
jgi:hypothetical protein